MKNKSMFEFGVLVQNHDEAVNRDDPPATREFRNRWGEEQYSRPVRVCLPSMSLRLGTAAGRDYLRAMRAAEMEAWALSGGDYLRSRPTTLHDDQNVVFLQSPPNALDYREENQTTERTL